MNKLLIIGPYPPPYGGISVHISRLCKHLIKSNIIFEVYNQYEGIDAKNFVKTTNGSYVWWLKFLFKRRSALVHFHQFSWFHFTFFLLYSLLNKNPFIITIHNENLLNTSWLVRHISLKLLAHSRYKVLLVVSRHLAEFLISQGLSNVQYLPAYVPPQPDTTGTKRHFHDHKVIACNIWRIDDEASILKYGLDFFLDIAEKYKEFKFNIYVGSPLNIPILNNHILFKGLLNVKVLIGNNLAEELPNIDFFLRLNREDAYGVSIQEAMDCNVPALASDVCERPQGSQLFVSGDFQSLVNEFERCIKTEKYLLLGNRKNLNYHMDLIGIYQQNLG